MNAACFRQSMGTSSLDSMRRRVRLVVPGCRGVHGRMAVDAAPAPPAGGTHHRAPHLQAVPAGSLHGYGCVSSTLHALPGCGQAQWAAAATATSAHQPPPHCPAGNHIFRVDKGFVAQVADVIGGRTTLMNKLQQVAMAAHAGVCVQLQGAAGLAGTTPLPANWGGGERATISQRLSQDEAAKKVPLEIRKDVKHVEGACLQHAAMPALSSRSSRAPPRGGGGGPPAGARAPARPAPGAAVVLPGRRTAPPPPPFHLQRRHLPAVQAWSAWVGTTTPTRPPPPSASCWARRPTWTCSTPSLAR